MDSIGTIVDCTMAAFAALDDVAAGDRPGAGRSASASASVWSRPCSATSRNWDEDLSGRLVDNYRRLWRADYKDRVALFPGLVRGRRGAPRRRLSARRRHGEGARRARARARRHGPAAVLPRHAHGRRGAFEAGARHAPGTLRRAGRRRRRSGDDRRHLVRPRDGRQRRLPRRSASSPAASAWNTWRRTGRSPSCRASASCRPGWAIPPEPIRRRADPRKGDRPSATCVHPPGGLG